MKKAVFILTLGVGLILIFVVTQTNQNTSMKDSRNMNYTISPDKMLLVLAAPSANDDYYSKYMQEIIDFQINYANKIIDNDEVRILVDKSMRKYYENRVSEDILINEGMYDIWMRDFTTINPQKPIQFVYTDASMTKSESQETQRIFNSFADQYNITRAKTRYILDGGNIVDNYNGKVVTTTRFLEDNNLNMTEAKNILKDLLNAQDIAIIQPDDAVLAHADGMVAWIDDNVLLVNDYTHIDLELQKSIMAELKESFSGVKIVTIPVEFDEGGIDHTKGISSACGININLVATYNTLYIPIFKTKYEHDVLRIIRANTSKKVIEVDARGICLFGGSVRCTTWQLDDQNIDL